MRSLPENWVGGSGTSAWFSTSDKLAGRDVIGDSKDDGKEWSIKYDDVAHDMFLFTTGDY